MSWYAATYTDQALTAAAGSQPISQRTGPQRTTNEVISARDCYHSPRLLRGVQNEDEGGAVDEDEHGRVGLHGTVDVFNVLVMVFDVPGWRWAELSPGTAC